MENFFVIFGKVVLAAFVLYVVSFFISPQKQESVIKISNADDKNLKTEGTNKSKEFSPKQKKIVIAILIASFIVEILIIAPLFFE